MRSFWWQQLPLLILIQLLEPGRTSHKIYAEALHTFKSVIESPQQSTSRIWRFPCLRQGSYLDCYELKDPGVASRLYKSRFRRIAATVDGDSGVPTLTPLQEANVKKKRNKKVAATIGGVVAALVVVVSMVLVYICLMRVKRFIRRSSETGSSISSPPIEPERGETSPYGGALSPYDMQNWRQLTFRELEQATRNFSQRNIIGEGGFGLAYKGLLQDGSIVAIKRRLRTQTRSFVHEAKRIALVQHINLVKLIRYYEDSHQQLLVYDYIPNGSVGNHLYDSTSSPIGKLDMWQRLSIALGVAKGLEHLHGLVPPLLHMHFRTSNVLVDENFTAKVSDYGLSKFLTEGDHAGSTSTVDSFLDPELNISKTFTEKSDVYSYGVFLLELISGRKVHCSSQLNSGENLVLQAKNSKDFNKFVDKTLGANTKRAAGQMMELALHCIDTNIKRPSMRRVVEELEQIQKREVGHLHSESIEIGAVTLGSELFK